MFSDLFNIAIRNVKRRGIRSWLTMIGIFIGIIISKLSKTLYIKSEHSKSDSY